MFTLLCHQRDLAAEPRDTISSGGFLICVMVAYQWPAADSALPSAWLPGHIQH